MRFYRDYEIEIIFDNDKLLIIKPPLKISFNCNKVSDKTLGKTNLVIYNLKESTRLALSKSEKQKDKRIHVMLSIGYDGRLQKLFSGDIHTCSSVRQGNDFTTSIEIYDGGYDYFNAVTAKTVTTKEQGVNSVVADMKNTTKGKVTKLQKLSRPKVLVGNSFKCIEELMSNDEVYYIDNGQLFIVKDNDVISSYEPVVSAKTGLLNTPSLEDKTITFETMLNPALRLSGKCIMQSQYASHLNALYRINSINYTGDLDGQSWKQSVEATLLSEYEVL